MKTTKLVLAMVISLFSYTVSIAQEPENSKEYTCSMHPEVISNKPEFCPKCGMKLIEKGSKANTNKVAPTYTCSMHPEVVSDTPDKCPKCGMNLVIKGENSGGKGMGCMGMMHGDKKHKGALYVVGGALMVGMMAVIMVLAAR
ncbi:MAG: hypothetical protein HYU68_06840 [Bacteroidetes bacterium]|nr:hypothetical protein [Bacteroidota bacterium]